VRGVTEEARGRRRGSCRIEERRGEGFTGRASDERADLCGPTGERGTRDG